MHASRSFNVIDFGTNRKLIIRFPISNSNLPPILHRFRDIAVDQGRSDGGYIGIYSLPKSVPENYFVHYRCCQAASIYRTVVSCSKKNYTDPK